MAVKLVANGCADEVGSIRIEPLLDEEIDMTKVYVAEVDGDLLAIAGFGSKLPDITGHCLHPYTIQPDGI